MKISSKYLPPLADGKYTITVTQSIETASPDPDDIKKIVTAQETFSAKKTFSILSRAFTLLQDDVFSVYPSENAEGAFSTELPFLVSSAKTMPWLYGDGDLPWIALIAVSEEENHTVKEQDISISSLIASGDNHTYFPAKAMPSQFTESVDDLCHIIDLPLTLFQAIMPRRAETGYLCHAKYADLSNTEEAVSSLDGFFSVVMGNRFIPPGKTTMHLISLLGYPDCGSGDYAGYETIRLVSLYHWTVFCEPNTDANFKAVIQNLDTKIFCGNYEHTLSKRGICAKPHLGRAGDITGSLYHSPFVPYRPKDIPQVSSPCHSADEILIYDKAKGVFDVSYAAAWQLGRLAALSRKSAAKAVSKLRGAVVKKCMLCENEKTAAAVMPDFSTVCKRLIKQLKQS